MPITFFGVGMDGAAFKGAGNTLVNRDVFGALPNAEDKVPRLFDKDAAVMRAT